MTDTIIESLERTFQRPFETRTLDDIVWRSEHHLELAAFLEGQFQHKDLPAKPTTCIRPAIFKGNPRRAGLTKVNGNLSFSEIKQALLYSNEVALDVSPILARARSARRLQGRSSKRNETARQRWRELMESIGELTEISSLLRTGVILPFSGNSLKGKSCIGGLIDPLFHSAKGADLYVQTLRKLNMSTSFHDSIIATVPTISSDAVGWSDLIVIRRNEEMFASWRELIYSILNELHSGKPDLSDAGSEFGRTIAERLREWKERAEARRMRSTALQRILAGARQIAFRWIDGTVALQERAGPSLLSSISSVAAQRKEDRASLGHHILVLTE